MERESELRQAHADLLACYTEIRQEFADLDDPTLASFLGKYDSPQFRQQVREHGDGYTMRSVPSSVEEILLVDKVVLIVMKYPLLNCNSVFRLHASLTDIPYWREGKCLIPEARLQNGDLVKFQFLVWQQDCGVHGESKAKALANQQFLFGQRPRLRELMLAQEQKSEKLLWSCIDWSESLDRELIVLTNRNKEEPKPPIKQIISDDRVLHISTKLYGTKPYRRRDCTIMDELICEISQTTQS